MKINHFSVVDYTTLNQRERYEVVHDQSLTPRWLGLACSALEAQLRGHVAPAWSVAPPGVTLETEKASTSSAETCVCMLVDADNDPEVLAVHGYLAGTPYVVVDVGQSMESGGLDALFEAMSHELCEALVNPMLDRWIGDYAVEIADPVQRQRYPVTGSVLGTSEVFDAANFVLPAWFDLLNVHGDQVTNWAQTPMKSFTVAVDGYAVRRDSSGRVISELTASLAPKLVRKNSRTARLAR